ncbi:MAG: DUF5681 domain-containing protein [Pseudomonadota bacterium]
MSKQDQDYDVGYGKPPKSGQFKNGQFGNPKGRPKGAKGFTASLKREMEAPISIQEKGQKLSVSKAAAAAKRLMNKALEGDITALKMLAAFDQDFEARAVSETAEAVLKPAQVDHAILRDYYANALP